MRFPVWEWANEGLSGANAGGLTGTRFSSYATSPMKLSIRA
jgi:hypothetical protein